jgi:hypothetical protein
MANWPAGMAWRAACGRPGRQPSQACSSGTITGEPIDRVACAPAALSVSVSVPGVSSSPLALALSEQPECAGAVSARQRFPPLLGRVITDCIVSRQD